VQYLPAAFLPPLHKPAVAAAEAEDTVAVVATSAALAEVTWVASAEVTWVALAEVTWRAWAEITLAAEAVISLTAAFTTTALVVRITHDTPGRTTAPIEWRACSEVADARISLSREPCIELTKQTSAHPGRLPKLDAAPCGIKFNSTNSIFAGVAA
jgi:hypothetical protein